MRVYVVLMCVLAVEGQLTNYSCLQCCLQLEQQLAPGDAEYREMRAQGHSVSLTVQWDGRAPGRAAAALLTAVLARGARYSDVRLARVSELALEQALFSNETAYDEYTSLEICPAAAQNPSAVSAVAACAADRLCAQRRAVLGPGAAPAALALLAHLARDVAARAECRRAYSWLFFSDLSAMERCGFLRLNSSSAATVFYLSEHEDVREQLSRAGLHWRAQRLGSDAEPRTALTELLRKGNESFLFVDHQVWSRSPRVLPSQWPPCTMHCALSLAPFYTVSLGHAMALDQYLPTVLNIARKFAPTEREIREILEEEADLHHLGVEDSEEAACAWAVKNIDRFKSWFEAEVEPTYWVAVLLCEGDVDLPHYIKIADFVSEALQPHIKFKFEIQQYLIVNCSNSYGLANVMTSFHEYRRFLTLLGVVGLGEGSRTAAALAHNIEKPLVLYDTVPELEPNEATRVIGGSVRQLATAVERLLSDCNWARLAVISDHSALAEGLNDALRRTVLVLRNAQLQTNTTFEIKNQLELFREADARIFYVNTDADTALVVLCAAMALDMTPSAGYVWLLREWRAQQYACPGAAHRMRHYTVSYKWRGQPLANETHKVDINWEVRNRLQEEWMSSPGAAGPGLSGPGLSGPGLSGPGLSGPGLAGPRLAGALADALLLLLHAAATFFTAHPHYKHDLHGDGTARMFWSSMQHSPAAGVSGKLHSTPYSSPEPVVYVDEWSGDRPRAAAVWTVGRTARGARADICGGDVTDGGRCCVTMRWYSAGDGFTWRCHDWAVLWCVLVAALAAPALLLARRARRARLRRDLRMLKAQQQARYGAAVGALSALAVERTALRLQREVGAGSFGRVCLAELRMPGRPTATVAAKLLPDDATAAEEADFLREACTLASLSHAHIVRLVGVVGVSSGDGPPLVLMEYAFFGDLAEYLRKRRYLAETKDQKHNPEAEHVSAESLTRLGGEAAAALDYLSTERLVHRDVRAANCLVDARRSLKLADFGLARQTSSKSEYLCARRGLFPVLWMAPESLARGVFSPASDVWALGVLLAELVSLGARPYGEWPPHRVLAHVVQGGRPPLPGGASDDTRDVLLSCWRDAPERRPTAGELCAHLRSRRRRAALAPALLPAHTPTDDDTQHTPDTLSLDAFYMP